MIDLVDKRSAKTRLHDWLKKKRYALSHEIILWGSQNFCNHPLRRLRELMAEGKVRRMPDEKRISYFGKGREKAYEIITWTNIPVTRVGSPIK